MWCHRATPLRVSVLGAVVLTLLAVLSFAVVHELRRPTRAAVSRPAPRPAAPSRPAFTRAEETYIHSLWPIHGDVERTTVRMSLGQIFYKTNDLTGTELRVRVDEALTTYRHAEERLQALQPPASLQTAHEQYVAAVHLFEKSALEVLKMFDDGREDHLLAAYPLNQEGSSKIREVGVKFWPEEFTPN